MSKNKGTDNYNDLFPSDALDAVLDVLEHGAKKYSPYGWREDSDMAHDKAASDRHLMAVERGEVFDSDSGLRSRAHAITRQLFMLSREIKKKKSKEMVDASA